MLGVMSPKEALKLAMAKNLDLVQIVPNAVPPVCKIMDYGKFQFEKAKREKESKKKQTTLTTKEIRLSAKIEKHDLDFKIKNARKFLENGDKVKVSIRFKGREMQYTKIGLEVLNDFAEALKDVGTPDKQPQLEGKFMMMTLSSTKTDSKAKS